MSVTLESYPMVKYFKLKNIQINTYVTVKSLLASSMSNWTNWGTIFFFLHVWCHCGSIQATHNSFLSARIQFHKYQIKIYFQDSISARHQNSTALKFVQENKPRWPKQFKISFLTIPKRSDQKKFKITHWQVKT